MKFRIIGQIGNIEQIAKGTSVKVRSYLRKAYGQGRWRKMKGIATVEMINGEIHEVELHWYEAHSIGKRDIKIKKYLD